MTFNSPKDRYQLNQRQGKTINARAALLETPDGRQERGLAIFVGGQPAAVIPGPDALRLAHQIAGQLNYINGQGTA